jgi:hypothetical protein
MKLFTTHLTEQQGTPIRTREPLIPKLNQFDKTTAADVREVDLDTEHFDPMA